MHLQSIVYHNRLNPIPRVLSKEDIFKKYRMFETDRNEDSKYFQFCRRKEIAYARETSMIVGRYLTLCVPKLARIIKNNYSQLMEKAKKNECSGVSPPRNERKRRVQPKSVVYKKVRHILPEEISRVGDIISIVKKNNYNPTLDPSFFVRI